jgi:hypothetical protein
MKTNLIILPKSCAEKQLPIIASHAHKLIRNIVIIYFDNTTNAFKQLHGDQISYYHIPFPWGVTDPGQFTRKGRDIYYDSVLTLTKCILNGAKIENFYLSDTDLLAMAKKILQGFEIEYLVK